jgi:hypothetical protein
MLKGLASIQTMDCSEQADPSDGGIVVHEWIGRVCPPGQQRIPWICIGSMSSRTTSRTDGPACSGEVRCDVLPTAINSDHVG